MRRRRFIAALAAIVAAPFLPRAMFAHGGAFKSSRPVLHGVCTGPCCMPGKYLMRDAGGWKGATLYVDKEGQYTPLQSTYLERFWRGGYGKGVGFRVKVEAH